MTIEDDDPRRPPPLPAAMLRYGTPDGKPPLTTWRKWTIFAIGLVGGTVFTFFVFHTLDPKWAKEILQIIIGLVVVKVAVGGAFLLPWRTRMFGLGLLLSIPLTVLVVILRVAIAIATSP